MCYLSLGKNSSSNSKKLEKYWKILKKLKNNLIFEFWVQTRTWKYFEFEFKTKTKTRTQRDSKFWVENLHWLKTQIFRTASQAITLSTKPHSRFQLYIIMSSFFVNCVAQNMKHLFGREVVEKNLKSIKIIHITLFTNPKLKKICSWLFWILHFLTVVLHPNIRLYTVSFKVRHVMDALIVTF